jgi:hypothetical protein
VSGVGAKRCFGYSNGNVVRVDVIVQEDFDFVGSWAIKLEKTEINCQLEGLVCQFHSIMYWQVPDERLSIRAKKAYFCLKGALAVLKDHIDGERCRDRK